MESPLREELGTSHRPGDPVPTSVSSFIGRFAEVADVRALLGRERLVTLTGAGGCGKTRLALEVLGEDGAHDTGVVVILDLAPITDEGAVAPALAKVLGLRPSGADSLDLVTRRLRQMRALVLLDTCEHVIGACARVVDAILSACGSVSVLATSREPLGVDGEVTYRVPSLSVPGPDAGDVWHYDSVALFIDRARRIRPNFTLDEVNAADVAAICRRLDGVPLAIELAAARTRVMSIDRIVAGLDDRFRLLTGGARTALPRQRTLQASVEWSFTLLGEAERSLFRRLAVFPGHFSLDAAEAVGSGDGVDPLSVLDLLSSLVEKSLVQTTDQSRYRMLETIRHFAQAQLAADPNEAAHARDQHLDHYGALSANAREGLESPAVLEWLDRLETEYDNLIAALTWAEQTERFELSGEMAADLGRYWRLRGKSAEGQGYLTHALARGDLPTALRAAVGVAAALIALHQWDLPSAESVASQALEAARSAQLPKEISSALIVLGWTESWTGRHELAQEHHAEAERIATDHDLPGAHANALYGLAMVPFARADMSASRPMLEQAADEARVHGEVDQLLDNLWNLFLLYWHTGRDDRAEAALKEGLELAVSLGDPDHQAVFTAWSAGLMSRRGAFDEAARLLDEAQRFAEVSASPLAGLTSLVVRGLHARDTGDLSEALAALGEAGNVFGAVNADLPGAYVLSQAVEAACLLGEADQAAALVESAVALRARGGGWFPPVSLAEAHLALERDELDLAEDLGHKALADAAEGGFEPNALETLELLGYLAIRQGSAAEGARLLGAAEHLRDDRSWVRPAGLAVLYGDALQTAHGDPAFVEGTALSLDEAVAYARRGRGERKRPAFGWQSLTPTELRVVEAVAEGLSNAEICERLFMSLGTVKTHLNHIYSKVGLRSRVQLAQGFSARSTR